MIIDVLLDLALIVLVVTALVITSSVLLSVHPTSTRRPARSRRRPPFRRSG